MPTEPRIRVCHLCLYYPPTYTGQGIQIERTLPHLSARGVDVTIVTREIAGLPAIERTAERSIRRILSPGAGRIALLQRIVQIRRFLSRAAQDFDLVHSNMVGWEFMLNVSAMRSAGLPVIVEMVLLGSDDPLTITRERAGSAKIGLLRPVDIWCGLSEAFRPRVAAAGLPSDRFRRIYPGVDPDAHRPLDEAARRALRTRLGLPPEARIVVSAGAVIHRKGVDRLLQAWRRYRPIPGRDLLLILGPATLEEGLEPWQMDYAMAQRRESAAPDLDGTVRFAGFVRNVNEYFSASDVFLFLSRQEGLGIVIIEALASGLPCVVSPLDGIASEILTDGRDGLIAHSPDDADAVAAMLAALLDQPALRSRMRDAARRTARENFTFEIRADALATLYSDLCRMRRRQPPR